MMRRTLLTLAAAATLSAPSLAIPSDAQAQPIVIGDGLVNVQIGDVDILRNVDVDAVVDVVAAANVCPEVAIENLNVLAQEVDQNGGTRTINCDADAESELAILQNTLQS